jgi:hypothetical protein
MGVLHRPGDRRQDLGSGPGVAGQPGDLSGQAPPSISRMVKQGQRTPGPTSISP